MATQTKKKKKRKERQYSSPKKRADEHKSGFSGTSFRRPDGMEMFQVKKEGVYNIVVLPYEVKCDHNPNADEGMMTYERTYWVHRGIGPEENSYTCNAKTFGEKCPICEDRAKMAKDKDSDEDDIKALAPKERQLMYILDRTDDKESVEVKLEERSHHLFGKTLDTVVKHAEEDEAEQYESFFHLEGGAKLKTVFEEKSFGGRDFMECKSIEIKPRKDDIDESVIEDLEPLDDLIIKTPYAELKKIYLQLADDEDDDKEEDDDTDEDEDAEDDKKSKKKKSTTKAKSKKSKDDEDDEEEEDDEEDDEDEKQDKKKKKKDAKKSKDDDDEEDGDEGEEDEEDGDDDEVGTEDEEEDESPKKGKGKAGKVKPADEMGIKVGSKVKHAEHGKCKVIFVNDKGTQVTIKDEDDTSYGHIDPYDCVLLVGKKKEEPEDDEEEEDEEPKAKKDKKADKKKSKPKDDDNEDEEDDESKSKKKKKKKSKDDDDEDMDLDD